MNKNFPVVTWALAFLTLSVGCSRPSRVDESDGPVSELAGVPDDVVLPETIDEPVTVAIDEAETFTPSSDDLIQAVTESNDEDVAVEEQPEVNASNEDDEVVMESGQLDPTVPDLATEATEESGLPLLTNQAILSLAYKITPDPSDEPSKVFKDVSRVSSMFNLHAVPADVYEYLTTQIENMEKAENFLVGVQDAEQDLYQGASMPTNKLRDTGTTKTSMAFRLLRFMIDELQEDADFSLVEWSEKTIALESRLDDLRLDAVSTFKGRALRSTMDQSLEIWMLRELSLDKYQVMMHYDSTIGPEGGMSVGPMEGVRRAGLRLITADDFKGSARRIHEDRIRYELALLDVDRHVGEYRWEKLTADERAHVEQISNADLKLNPKLFYNVIWQGHRKSDQSISAFTEAIKRDPSDGAPRIERGKLYAKKGIHPYMTFVDLREGLALDPDREDTDELMASLELARQKLEMQSDRAGRMSRIRFDLEREGF